MSVEHTKNLGTNVDEHRYDNVVILDKDNALSLNQRHKKGGV